MSDDYALYKGDTFLYIGTLSEIAQYLGVKYETVRFMNSSVYKKRAKDNLNNRKVLIKIEDDEDEET